MNIACLGWGSLIWNPGSLPICSAWHGDGPALPVEFARQSADGRITLVIADGAKPVQVLWAKLEVTSLDEAVAALADREGVPNPKVIGRWPPANIATFDQSDLVESWAQSKGLDGVVWTALPPGLVTSRGVVPSLAELTDHIASLSDAARVSAAEYVERAPKQIDTAYRRALAIALAR